MLDNLNNIEKLLSHAFDQAPRQLNAHINIAIHELRKKPATVKSCGLAFNELRAAQKMVDEQQLTELFAEMHAAWAVYFYNGCANMEKDGRSTEEAMYYHIRQTQRLEPNNPRLNELIAEIKKKK